MSRCRLSDSISVVPPTRHFSKTHTHGYRPPVPPVRRRVEEVLPVVPVAGDPSDFKMSYGVPETRCSHLSLRVSTNVSFV